MAKIKIATPSNDLPRFIEGGLTVTNGWSELDLDSVTDEQRDTLLRYTGTHVRVHEEDVDAFRSWAGKYGAQYDAQAGTMTDPQREQREQERQAAAAQQRDVVARGTSPGQPQAFSQPPSARERDASDTAPDKPSNLNRDARDKNKPR